MTALSVGELHAVPQRDLVEARRLHRVRTAGRQARANVQQRGHAQLRRELWKQGA